MASVIDIPMQFPNSMMAQAVRNGQSRFVKADTSTTNSLTEATAETETKNKSKTKKS